MDYKYNMNESQNIMLGEKVMIPLPENLKNTMSTLLS